VEEFAVELVEEYTCTQRLVEEYAVELVEAYTCTLGSVVEDFAVGFLEALEGTL
jgi:hypothetical protein